MDEDEVRSETVEIESDRWVLLELSREWPKYILEWSIRQKAGDGDFPVANGRVDAMPPTPPQTMDDVYDDLRTRALSEANAASAAAATPAPRRSLLSRLLGRK